MSILDDLLKFARKETASEITADFMGGLSHIQSGVAARRAGSFQAEQLRINAGQSMASAQRAAHEVDREAQYIASAALASAAASGGGASDPTVVNLIARNAGEMAYRKSIALYEGEDRARIQNLQAAAAEYGGKSDQVNSLMAAAGSIYKAQTSVLKGQAKEASILQRFGGGGPKGAETAPDRPWWETN